MSVLWNPLFWLVVAVLSFVICVAAQLWVMRHGIMRLRAQYGRTRNDEQARKGVEDLVDNSPPPPAIADVPLGIFLFALIAMLVTYVMG